MAGASALSATAGATAGAVSARAAEQQRLQRIVDAVARQEPRISWAAGLRDDGTTTLLVTDLAGGWIPPHVRLPANVTLLEPTARRRGLRLRRLRYLRTAAARRPQVTTPGGRAQVLAAIQKALDIKGVHDPAARARWTRGMDLVARRESNYNANAINHWDSNAARGTPSRGVWQFIAPTFAAYHEPGTSTNIHDLVAQACAFINYARGHYGVAADASNLADLIQQADPRRSPRGY